MKKLNVLAALTIGLAIFLTACSIYSNIPTDLTLEDGTVLKCLNIRIDTDTKKIVCTQNSSQIIVDYKNVRIIKKN